MSVAKNETTAKAGKVYNICIVGATGRMGKEINDAMRSHEYADKCNLALAINKNNQDEIAKINNDTIDIVIDFSSPSATKKLINHLIDVEFFGVVLIGTTGLTDDITNDIKRLSKYAKVVVSSNTSIGAMVAKKISAMVAKILPEADIEIFESHHKHKKDSPSGTAISLGKSMAQARGVEFDDVAVFGRSGSEARKDGEIGFCVSRGGGVVGEHSAMFFLENEVIEVRHSAGNRCIFANGAIKIAMLCVANKTSPCLVEGDDILDLL